MIEEQAVPLPRAAVVRTALRRTTERLAAELANPQDEAPGWNDFEWRTAMAVSVMHGISALLARRLRWAGPACWQAFLAEQADQGRAREQKTRALLQRLDDAARQAGIPLLAMKGSALLKLGLYEPGHRPMSDVDLLARPEDFDAVHRLLLAHDYAQGVISPRHRAYDPAHTSANRAFGEHATNPIKIELHTAVMETLPVREVAITAQMWRHDAHAGVNAYPSTAALMRHLLLHAAGNLCASAIRLIQLHDLAVLAPHLDESDWAEALATASDGLPAWWAAPVIDLAMRLFPDRWPHSAMAGPLDAATAACPPLLRRAMRRDRLDEVSMSRFRIPMLPGMGWSHSAVEAWACVTVRVRPGRDAMRHTQRAAHSVHAFASSPWTDRPRWQKALRFLLGAPPRVGTMYSLQRALAYDPPHSNPA